jgi:pSer/pThr/pTyr-binding forkhead associated (FHA) protein
MADPRLNSIHLESFRRDDFRRAREVLVGSVGEQTQNAVGVAELAPPAPSGSKTQNLDASHPISPSQDFVLIERGAIYNLRVGVNTVGRLSDNDVVLPDPYLSRRHCAILIHASQACELHDVASKNGTFLNGRKIEGPTAIKSGDEIRICERQLVFLRRSDVNDASPSDRTMVG